MSTSADINNLLDDKLFQVIGSTPASIADSLRKVDLSGKRVEGIQVVAISIFAAAVNKSTLETFLADTRFANVRSIIAAAISIQGRSNMTALTLLGHCFLTTDIAADITFAREFRKKLGQNHLWAGELTSGSLSDKQRKILQEKRRVTSEADARALGSGFLKFTGIVSAPFTELEASFFGVQAPVAPSNASAPIVTRGYTDTRSRPAAAARAPTEPTTRRSSDPDYNQATIAVRLRDGSVANVPEELVRYRMSVLGQTNEDIVDSIARRSLQGFIDATNRLIRDDPDGSKLKSASTVGASAQG